MSDTDVIVHEFEVWDSRTGAHARSIRKASAEVIARIDGARLIPGTGEPVAPGQLDSDGFYDPNLSEGP